MKTLILMRHAHAVSNNSAYTDHERPLSEEGRAAAKNTSQLLAEWPIDEIVCSSATRTVETANIIAASLQYDVNSHSTRELYLASPGSYSAVAATVVNPDAECVVMIGHNPGIASLICTWADDSLPIFPATVAVFQLAADNWKQLGNMQQVTKQFTAFVSNGVRVR